MHNIKKCTKKKGTLQPSSLDEEIEMLIHVLITCLVHIILVETFVGM